MSKYLLKRFCFTRFLAFKLEEHCLPGEAYSGLVLPWQRPQNGSRGQITFIRSSFREWCSAHSVRDVWRAVWLTVPGTSPCTKTTKIVYCFLVKNIGFLEKVSFKSLLDPPLFLVQNRFFFKKHENLVDFPKIWKKIREKSKFSIKKQIFRKKSQFSKKNVFLENLKIRIFHF